MIHVLVLAMAQEVLVHEDFTDGALTEGVWEARLNLTDRRHVDPTMRGERLAAFNSLTGGYLHFWGPDRGQEPPSLRTLRSFERKDSRAFLVSFCGTVHRGGAIRLGFEGGPAWQPGQRQGGPFINSARAIPDGPAVGNHNVDTLFAVVLRDQGAFWLMDRRLCFVSASGPPGPFRAQLQGADAHARFRHVAVVDLGADFIRPRPLAEADGAAECTATPAAGARSLTLSLRGLRLELSTSGVRLLHGDTALGILPEPRLEPGRPIRLFLRADGAAALDDRALALPFRVVVPGPPGGAVSVDGPVEIRGAQGWPEEVELPALVKGWLPPTPARADGPVFLRDDFDGPALRPAWRAVRGEWSVSDGALALAKAPGQLLADVGTDDYEVSATIEFRGPPEFPAVTARADGPRPSGWLTARYLWQSASPEIEVWDRPHESGWTTVLANATNITGLIRPGETHVLRLGVRGGWASYWRDDLLVGTCPTRSRRGPWAGLQMDEHGNASCRWLNVEIRGYRK